MRLVIAGVDNGSAVRLQAVSQGQRRMVQVARGDLDIPDPQLSLDKVMVADGGAKLFEAHWKVGVLHLARERLAQ